MEYGYREEDILMARQYRHRFLQQKQKTLSQAVSETWSFPYIGIITKLCFYGIPSVYNIAKSKQIEQ